MLPNRIRAAVAAAVLLLAGVGGTLAVLPAPAAPDEPAKRAAGREGAGEAAAPPQVQFPDLAKIDRAIVKEPKYATQPYYALLAIGPRAEKRVWLVVDGETLYVDRNGNGDLTEPNERVQRPKRIEVAPGMYRRMDSFELGEVHGQPLRLDFWVRDGDFVPRTPFDRRIRQHHEEFGWESATLFRVKPDGSNVPAQVPVTFCRQPKEAQVCHLAGPLTFALRSNDPLVRGSDGSTLGVMIGTPGLPPRNCDDRRVAPLATTEVPADRHPVAHFVFPPRGATGPPIKLKVALDQRC